MVCQHFDEILHGDENLASGP